MSFAERTFCWLDTKWLCQNSVMRSASGDSVASISRIHQPRISNPRRTCSRMYARRSSFVAPSGGAPIGASSVSTAGGVVTGSDRGGRRPEAGAGEQVPGAVVADRRTGVGQRGRGEQRNGERRGKAGHHALHNGSGTKAVDRSCNDLRGPGVTGCNGGQIVNVPRAISTTRPDTRM